MYRSSPVAEITCLRDTKICLLEIKHVRLVREEKNFLNGLFYLLLNSIITESGWVRINWSKFIKALSWDVLVNRHLFNIHSFREGYNVQRVVFLLL